ncbi:L,D-transpeptidase family protein [bacterium]|nr:L,D-transpeptidase family protein [bacterium]
MRTYRHFLVPIALAAVFAASACTFYYQAQASRAVDNVHADIPALLRARAQADTAVLKAIAEHRAKAFAETRQGDTWIADAGVLAPESALRFVADHAAAADHDKLVEALRASRDDGLSPDAFQVNEMSARAKTLSEYEARIANAVNVTLDEAGRARLVEDLVAAAKKDEDKPPRLDGLGIVDFMLKPAHRANYPDIAAAYDKAAELVAERGVLETQIETAGTRAYFKLARAMGLKREMAPASWEASKSDLTAAVKQMAPSTPHYVRLRGELGRYRRLAEKYADLPPVKASVKLKKGAKDSDTVRTVQERLSLEGYYSGPIDGHFDEVTEAALIEYQQTHQVVPDGVIFKGTAEAMNVSYEKRVRQIRLALAKLRQSDSRWENYFVRVNIPEFMVEVVEDGKILRRHKVIVGNRAAINHTPEFTATIKTVVYNPAWYMTSRIFKLEELPNWHEDPDYFKKKGYVAHFNKEGIPIAAYQPPGPGNALGKVKILFPNKNDVYMHDTPTKYLFNRNDRAFSHGCIRLHNPLDMAQFLLEKDGNAALAELDKILDSRSTREIVLNKEIPIFIEYVTVSTDEQGRAVFLFDVYDEEDKQFAAMEEMA